MEIEETIEVQEKKPSMLSRTLKVTLPLLLGIFIIYMLVKDMDPAELWSVLKDANWGILCFSLIFGFLGNTIRGFRWNLFIEPLGYKPKISNLCFAVYGSYAINFGIPRAGELWKCVVVAKHEKIPFAKLFGTMILDRIFDTITVILITIGAFSLNVQFFKEQLLAKKEFETITTILTSVFLYLGIIIGLVLLIFVFKKFKHNKLIQSITDFLTNMGRDLKAIWKMKTKGRLLLYTIGIWVSYFLYFYITFYAFGFTENLGFTAGLIAFALGSLSMGVPSNGGLGPWHAAIIAALMLYGVDKVSAMGYATGVFAIQSAWVVVYGLFGIAMLAIRSRKAK